MTQRLLISYVQTILEKILLLPFQIGKSSAFVDSCVKLNESTVDQKQSTTSPS